MSAAEDGVRAAGIICPSCGENWADVHRTHRSSLRVNGDAAWAEFECRDGRPVDFWAGPYEVCRLAANVSLLDEVRRREDIEFRKLGFPV